MYEEVITGLMLELVMTLTDHIDCIVDKIKIILDLNLMEWNSEILKKKLEWLEVSSAKKKKGTRILFIWAKETRRMRCCLKKRLEKVQHRAIHVAFIILGDLIGRHL